MRSTWAAVRVGFTSGLGLAGLIGIIGVQLGFSAISVYGDYGGSPGVIGLALQGF